MLCTLAICIAAGFPLYDGDTILRGPDRIRIWGIDAPELQDKGGRESRDFLKALVEGKPLACDLINRDHYGRRVAQCFLPDGRDLACEMIKAGQAKEWTRYSGGAYEACSKA